MQAHLALRPALSSLRAAQVPFEAAVQAALRGEDHGALFVQPSQVAPVWLWLAADAPEDAAASAPAASSAQDHGLNPDTEQDPSTPSDASRRRRRARRADTGEERNPLLVAPKTESITTWSEFVRLARGSDDEPDPNAQAAADDMDQLTLARGQQTTASRVKFDLDLPSASADDEPLGPGRKTPEWDWRRQTLLPDHCAVQCLVPRFPG